MPYNVLPEHLLIRRDHSFQRMLNLLDQTLVLVRNAKAFKGSGRWEVWRCTPDWRGIHYGFICATPRGYEPGEWLLEQLRARDSRHAGAKVAWENVRRELDADEAKVKADQDRAHDKEMTEIAEEIAADYRPEAIDKVDPHYNSRQRKGWDPEPIIFDMGPRAK